MLACLIIFGKVDQSLTSNTKSVASPERQRNTFNIVAVTISVGGREEQGLHTPLQSWAKPISLGQTF